MKFLLWDADNVLWTERILLIDTREQVQGLSCGYCSYATRVGRVEGAPCTLNSIDAGIAIDSACAAAADLWVDIHVMSLAGLAVQRLD